MLRSALAKAAPPGLTYDFDQERIVIGRGTGADVRIPHRAVSELHATLQLQRGRFVLLDHESTNGTYVDGQRLVPGRPKPLEPGAIIACGTFELVFQTDIVTASITSAERTASLARRMLREVIDPDSEAGAPPRLVVTAGPDVGARVELTEVPCSLVIGHGDGCGWTLQDTEISREHVELLRDVDGVVARDLGSESGIDFGGRSLRERRLRHGDRLRIGVTELCFEDPAEQALQTLVGEEDLASPLTATRPLIETPDAAQSATDDDDSAAGAGDVEAPSADGTAAPENDAGMASVLPANGITPAPSRGFRPTLRGADVIIYLLAAMVLSLSIAGLVVLLRAGP